MHQLSDHRQPKTMRKLLEWSTGQLAVEGVVGFRCACSVRVYRRAVQAGFRAAHLGEQRGVVGHGEAAQRADEELQRAVCGHQVVQAARHARRVARGPCRVSNP